MRSNHLLRSVSYLVLLAILVAAGAHGRVVALGRSTVEATYCAGLSTAQQRLDTSVAKQLTTLSMSWQTQADRLQLLQASQQATIRQLRADADAAQQTNTAALRARAGSDVEQSSVDDYAAALRSAELTRRQTTDNAEYRFRQATDRVLQDHQATVSGQVQALRLSLADAYNAAENSCHDNQPTQTVHDQLQAALAIAQHHFTAERRQNPDLAAQLQQVESARDTALQAANAAFQAHSSSLRTTL